MYGLEHNLVPVLQGETLVHIGFFKDRIQLGFNDIELNIFSRVHIQRSDVYTYQDEPGWINHMCSYLEQIVSMAYTDDNDFVIEFEDGTSMIISISMKDRVGDYAVHMKVSDFYW